jgi:2-polyprenyl-3-methyl-5-hydroxy-6-metoxy-1,4-benzoquinol methylase
MKCKLCNSENVLVTYDGQVRAGGLGQYTQNHVKMWKCNECKTIWHEPLVDNKQYYETEEYRNVLEGSAEEKNFYLLHDKENLEKFKYTGTNIFRGETVADIGCAAGSFLDFVKGAASDVVAIEPSETYREVLLRKGYHTYAYADDAKTEWGEKISVITSFDVIEHVEDPVKFMEDVYDLLKVGGKAIIGTPTEAPVMRDVLGEIYEKQVLFSVQHLWVLGEESLKLIAKKAGFKNIGIKYYQRYGVNNFLGWLSEKKPKSKIQSEYISGISDAVWRSELENKGLADYVVIYLEK